MPEDGPLEARQRRAGLEPELRDERLAGVAIDGERLGLPAAPVEGQHELAARALAERLLRDQPLELGDQRAVPAEREVRLDALLESGDPQLLELRDVQLQGRLVRDVGERGAAPQPQRLAQLLRRALREAGGERPAAVLDEPLEPLGVELAGADPEQVAGGAGHERAGRARSRPPASSAGARPGPGARWRCWPGRRGPTAGRSAGRSSRACSGAAAAPRAARAGAARPAGAAARRGAPRARRGGRSEGRRRARRRSPGQTDGEGSRGRPASCTDGPRRTSGCGRRPAARRRRSRPSAPRGRRDGGASVATAREALKG